MDEKAGDAVKTLKVLVCLLIVFSFASAGFGQSGNILKESDLSIVHQPTGQIIVAGKQVRQSGGWAMGGFKDIA